jgi:hypothetical protein
MNNPLQTEPVATLGGAVLGVFIAGIALLPTFGIPVDGTQQAGLIAFVTSIITLVTIWQRQSVYAPDTVEQIKENAEKAVVKAYKATPGVDPLPRIEKAA